MNRCPGSSTLLGCWPGEFGIIFGLPLNVAYIESGEQGMPREYPATVLHTERSIGEIRIGGGKSLISQYGFEQRGHRRKSGSAGMTTFAGMLTEMDGKVGAR